MVVLIGKAEVLIVRDDGQGIIVIPVEYEQGQARVGRREEEAFTSGKASMLESRLYTTSRRREGVCVRRTV